MKTLTYRRSSASDAELVFGLVANSVSRLSPIPYSQETVDTWMHGRTAEDYRDDCARQVIWIAEQDRIPVGFAHGIPGEVLRLFVKAKSIGLGAGAGLMRRALQDALPNGTGKVRIDATLNAVSFYEKWGFTKVGSSVFSGRSKDLPPIEITKMEKTF